MRTSSAFVHRGRRLVTQLGGSARVRFEAELYPGTTRRFRVRRQGLERQVKGEIRPLTLALRQELPHAVQGLPEALLHRDKPRAGRLRVRLDQLLGDLHLEERADQGVPEPVVNRTRELLPGLCCGELPRRLSHPGQPRLRGFELGDGAAVRLVPFEARGKQPAQPS